MAMEVSRKVELLQVFAKEVLREGFEDNGGRLDARNVVRILRKKGVPVEEVDDFAEILERELRADHEAEFRARQRHS